MTPRLRIGILGAAGIAPKALITPAAERPDVEIAAVAARNRDRAVAFAETHGIATVHETYDDVLADESLEAIYIPLPISHHAEWAIKTLQAGKHLLLEKAFTNNVAEARAVAGVAELSGKVCMEAFHNRYHRLHAMAKELLPRIGRITRADADFLIDLGRTDDIRYRYETGGGATMDLGCYPVHYLRTLLEIEPTVVSATYEPAEDPRVDESLSAECLFGEIPSTIISSLKSQNVSQTVEFTGEHGSLRVEGYVHPQKGNRIQLTVGGVTEEFSAPEQPTSYAAQLAAFVAAIREGGPNLTNPDDSVATMKVLDAMYEAAGLTVRGS